MVHAWLARMQSPRQTATHRGDDLAPALGTVALMSGIVEDARDLVAAHVEALRDDILREARYARIDAGLMLIAVGVFR